MAVKPGVLIVDDSITVRMDLDAAFRAAGFAPTLCGSAAAARGALSQSIFALIVLDVVLPDADGIDLLRELKGAAATSGIPVLLLSTEAEVSDRVRGLRTGADEYVGKPYDAAYVVGRARELVSRGQPIQEVGARTSVLIIDDSSTFRETLGSFLNANGYSVATAGSGEDGLREVVNLRPRAVIVDGMLPGIDGATVVRRMKQDASLRQTPCLLLTGSEDSGEELRALDAGADVYVRKEEPLEVIVARLAAVLRFSGDPSPRTAASPSLLGPKKVLTVDDSPTYLEELGTHLREEGYEPVLARSGEEALELLEVQPVDCILLDLIMPGMSGYETCRRIKASATWKDIPLVILTAREGRDAMIEGINTGADDYIAKSSDFEVLKARLRAQFRRKQSEDENRAIREQQLSRNLEAAEAHAALELAETRAKLLTNLEQKNQELEAFSYSVSHDLRAPLRAIDGFSRILLTEHSDRLDEEGKRLLIAILTNAIKMDELISALLNLSRMGRTEMQVARVDMKSLAESVMADLLAACPERKIEATVASLPEGRGDAILLRQVFNNLIGNAIKYSSHGEAAQIEVGCRSEAEENIYFVKDNGTGFDMRYANKLFGVFQRLHRTEDYEGNGVGLAIVQRIIHRHGGRVWAKAEPNKGAEFCFTLGG